MTQTPPKKKAKELAKLLRAEQPDYPYLKSVFRALRAELEIRFPAKRRGSRTSPRRTTFATSIRQYGTGK